MVDYAEYIIITPDVDRDVTLSTSTRTVTLSILTRNLTLEVKD